MKIGIVLSKNPAYSETFFISKIKGLQNNGFTVVLFCQKKDPDFNLCPVVLSTKVYRNPLLLFFYFMGTYVSLLPNIKAVLKFAKIERNSDTSIAALFKNIYLNSHLLKAKVDWLHFGFATQAIGRETIAEAIGAKMAVSLRGFDMAVYPLKHPNCYTKLWQNVTKVHSISNALLQLAYQNGLPRTVEVVKITPAIDTSFFGEVASENLGNHKKINFLTVGRLHYIKGYVLMLEALLILKQKGIQFTYTIVGSTASVEYERIAFAALQLDLKDEVIFKGKLNAKAVKDEYAKAEIYLQYSLSEGFCNAVLEAQAVGLLCIVSDAHGLPENILHEKTGWVVPKNNPALLAQTIEMVINTSEEKKKFIIKNAVERVKTEFNIEKQQQEFINFYTSKK